jgi:membrane fusion protein, adhesin transport system
MRDDLLPLSRDPKHQILYHSHMKAHALLWASMAVVAVSLIWSCFTYLDELTRADHASVVPTGQTKVIQSLEGGIVEKIFVKEGQLVKQGELLAEIDDTSAKSLYDKNQHEIIALQLKCARLIAEANAVPFLIPADLKKVASKEADSEYDLYLSRQKEMELKIQAVSDEAKQTEQSLLEEKAGLEQLETTLSLKKKEFDMLKNLQNNGAVSPQELLQAEKAVVEAEGQIKQTQYRIEKINQQKIGIKNKKEEIKSSYEKDAYEEYNRSKLQLSQIQDEQISISDKVARTQLKSPVHGIIKKLYVNTEGGVLRPGDTLFEIVPKDEKLIIEAKINPKDIGFIHEGMRARVKITAYDFSLYGGLEGEVESISPDVLVERDQTYYMVRIKTDRSYLERMGHRYDIIPGMAASVDILTGKKTVMSYILKPIIKARQRAMTER